LQKKLGLKTAQPGGFYWIFFQFDTGVVKRPNLTGISMGFQLLE